MTCIQGRTHMITYQGRTQSISDWAAEAGIAPTTLSNRLYRGWTMERALAVPVRRTLAIEYDGKVWPLAELAKHLGISYRLLTGRLNAGIPIEDAIDPGRLKTHRCKPIPAERRRGERYLVDGEYKLISELAEERGLNTSAIYKRLSRGESLEQALRPPNADRPLYTAVWHGEKLTLPISEWAKTTGIGRKTLTQRLHDGWPPQKAFTTPVRENVRYPMDEETRYIREWAQVRGVSNTYIRNMVVAGMPICQALSMHPKDWDGEKRPDDWDEAHPCGGCVHHRDGMCNYMLDTGCNRRVILWDGRPYMPPLAECPHWTTKPMEHRRSDPWTGEWRI